MLKMIRKSSKVKPTSEEKIKNLQKKDKNR